ncbi:MAG TPA: ferrous iron transporter B [Vicinamibacterales bacterium]|nr:ferrous iron transporter B [Vicinamibacterales bacterium]
MSCHVAVERAGVAPPLLQVRARPLTVVLIGNPNVGKSVLFGRLTGRYATVSNYPGTTVSITRGRTLLGGEVFELIDSPGVNALEGALSEDEHVTRRLLANREVDLVVQVADARNLRRALMLTAHISSFGLPMLLVLNMTDEAQRRGVDVDAGRLAKELGIPVVEAVATEGVGIRELKESLSLASPARVPFEALADPASWAHDAAGRLRRLRSPSLGRFQVWLAQALRTPLTGLPILAVVLYGVYLAVGVFGAQVLVGVLEDQLFGRVVNPAATRLVTALAPVALLRDFLVGEYGLITMGLTYAVAIVLPVVATFFLVFSWLEDSGYIPRLAIFSDRIFRMMGLNGKAVLPMVLGLGCDTMATMTTRILGTPKERMIAVLLLALAVPCSAQLATILGILGGISFAALTTLFVVVLAQMFAVGFLAARVLPGDRSDFILEMPPIRWPSWRNVFSKTALRVRWYLSEAVPLFLFGTALLFLLDKTGGLALLINAGRPLVSGLLGLPAETAQVFVMGFLRRDYGAAGLFQLFHAGHLTGVQAVVALTVMTLFVPCVAHFLMIIREQGARVAVGILVFVTAVALGTGAGLHHVIQFLGIRF